MEELFHPQLMHGTRPSLRVESRTYRKETTLMHAHLDGTTNILLEYVLRLTRDIQTHSDLNHAELKIILDQLLAPILK